MSGAEAGVDAIAMTMRFGDFLALDDVELKVRPGNFHALLGENGAGKSTLVKCIMGYYQATAGDIVVGGREHLGAQSAFAGTRHATTKAERYVVSQRVRNAHAYAAPPLVTWPGGVPYDEALSPPAGH